MDNSDSYESKELVKPCPFCGSQPRLSYDRSNDENWLACENEACDVTPRVAGPGIRQVTDSWNTRSTGPESEAVKLLRRCHDAGDLVTPLDETLRDDVATFFGGKDG
jgi:hypothetical protein